jgi:uncharacterized surface protein with fasciclin (FAS1) repeats
MKRTHRNTLLLALAAALSLAGAGCKKKQADNAAATKTTEGSAAPGSAAPAGSATEPGGSAVPAAAGSSAEPTPAAAGAKSILETAKAAGTFATFLKAVDAAGLTERLNGPGPFTVFAPNDEAFAKIPAKDLEALLADKPKLEALLQHHIIAGAVASKDLASQKAVKSVQGDELAIDAASGVTVGGAKVVTPDIAASNGVIHTIDKVLVPVK